MGIRDLIENSDPKKVIEGAKSIKTNEIKKYRLLGKTNFLKDNSIEAIKRHFNINHNYRFRLTTNQFKTYIAASNLIHLFNGWSYFSKSIESLVTGEEEIAIHLGYYSELRASMSFLSSQGIGTFGNDHISINSNNQIDLLRSHLKPNGRKIGGYPTHDFIWDCIEALYDSNSKPEYNLLETFTIKGFSMKKWIEEFHSNSSTLIQSENLVKEWLKEWNFDVQTLRDDKKLRNKVSYNPTSLNNLSYRPSPKNIIKKLALNWYLIAPHSSNSFYLLDQYLFRKLLHKLYENLVYHLGIRSSFGEMVEEMVEQMGINDPSFLRFLKYEHPFDKEHGIFTESTKMEYSAIPVICRALLMLRVSTGMTQQLLRKSDFEKGDLDFLWNYFGIRNGFWSTEKVPETFENLWFDVQELVEDLYDGIEDKEDLTLFELKEKFPKQLSYFTQFNRANFWGLFA